MTGPDDRALRRQRIDDLLSQIDAQRRQQLLLEASGATAPVLELEQARTRQQLAELVG
ncbi:MAG TPA: hypothetical protein VFL58_07265 [Gaiellaceae bacterium]|nr:hypothetical protein [Gaiellaceae bacterium]